MFLIHHSQFLNWTPGCQGFPLTACLVVWMHTYPKIGNVQLSQRPTGLSQVAIKVYILLNERLAMLSALPVESARFPLSEGVFDPSTWSEVEAFTSDIRSSPLALLNWTTSHQTSRAHATLRLAIISTYPLHTKHRQAQDSYWWLTEGWTNCQQQRRIQQYSNSSGDKLELVNSFGKRLQDVKRLVS